MSGYIRLRRTIRPPFLALCLVTALGMFRPLSAHEENETIYTVQRGETLSEIAQRNGTDTATLRRINDLDSADLIFYGLTLLLPNTAPGQPSLVESSIPLPLAPITIAQVGTV